MLWHSGMCNRNKEFECCLSERFRSVFAASLPCRRTHGGILASISPPCAPYYHILPTPMDVSRRPAPITGLIAPSYTRAVVVYHRTGAWAVLGAG